MRLLMTLTAIGLGLLGTAKAQEDEAAPAPVPASGRFEAREAFQDRQADLISLSGHFGALHRLRQLCTEGDDVDLYRNKMRALVPLESPMERTRQEMIDSFNGGYRAQSAQFDYCTPEAEAAYRTEAIMALSVANRLASEF